MKKTCFLFSLILSIAASMNAMEDVWRTQEDYHPLRAKIDTFKSHQKLDDLSSKPEHFKNTMKWYTHDYTSRGEIKSTIKDLDLWLCRFENLKHLQNLSFHGDDKNWLMFEFCTFKALEKGNAQLTKLLVVYDYANNIFYVYERDEPYQVALSVALEQTR